MDTMAALTYGNRILGAHPHRRLQAPSDLLGLGLLRIHPVQDLTSVLDLDRPKSNQSLSMQVPLAQALFIIRPAPKDQGNSLNQFAPWILLA